MTKALIFSVALLLALPGHAATALAQERPPQQLQGTLKKIAAGRTAVIGYRASSFPFSYLDSKGRPIGYTIDICREIVADIRREIDDAGIAVAFRPVTAADRIDRLQAGDIDLECGSTTATAERRRLAAFSPVVFVSGTKLMVRQSSGIRTYRDLKGKSVAVIAGTTNQEALVRLDRDAGLGARIVPLADYDEALRQVADGRADAMAGDEVLLHGLVARHGAGRTLSVVGEFLSYEPYGIMYRRDDVQLDDVVVRALRRMAANRDLAEIYHRWFIRRMPTGERLDQPMTPELSAIFRLLGAPD